MNSKPETSQAASSQTPGPSVRIILNSHAGSDNEALFAEVAELFKASGLNPEISIIDQGHQVAELARQAADSDCKIVVAGGGDGTVSTIAGSLLGTNKTLGVLPLGTLNHFAKDLRIPLELADAVRTIISGRVKEVDAGEVNGHYFINNSSLGLYPSLVREREKKQRLGYRKWPAFVWAAFTVLRRYPFLGVRLTVDGKEIATRTPFVFVGNNEYQMESFQVGGRECLDAGHLSLYVSHGPTRLGLLRLALRALFGGLRQERDFIELCSKEIWIDTRRRLINVALDGEVRAMKPPLHYRVRPKSLRVLVPSDDDESERT